MSPANNALPDLYYERTGDGPDVLLVHGFASSGRMWERLVPVLGSDHRCWAVDLCGFGRSHEPRASLDLDFHLATLLQFCAAHDIRRCVVVGHSMGGMLALMLALARPDLVARLVLLCPTVTGRFGLGANRLLRLPVASHVLVRTRPLWSALQSPRLDPLIPGPFYLSRAERLRMKQDVRRARWQASVQALLSLAHHDLRPQLSDVTQPALVIVGGHDYTVPPSDGRLAARRMPHARLLELPRAHHGPLDEEPEIVVPAICDFVRTPFEFD